MIAGTNYVMEEQPEYVARRLLELFQSFETMTL
jgi:hypothetical protein